MNKAKIIQNGNMKFLEDIELAKTVVVHAEQTGAYIKITKDQAITMAENYNVKYIMSDGIFKVKRTTMVIK